MFRLLLLLAVVGGVAFFGVTYFSNQFNKLRDQAQTARRRLIERLEKRMELLRKLQTRLEGTDSVGRNAINSAVRLAAKATQTGDLAELALLLEDKNGHLERAGLQLRNPNLTEDSNRLLPILEELDDNTRNVELSVQDYNQAARNYNQMTQTGASSFVAKIMKYEPLPEIKRRD